MAASAIPDLPRNRDSPASVDTISVQPHSDRISSEVRPSRSIIRKWRTIANAQALLQQIRLSLGQGRGLRRGIALYARSNLPLKGRGGRVAAVGLREENPAA